MERSVRSIGSDLGPRHPQIPQVHPNRISEAMAVRRSLPFLKSPLKSTSNISAKTFSQVHTDARTARQGLNLDKAPLEVVLDRSGKNAFASGALIMKSRQFSENTHLKPIADRSTNRVNREGNTGIHGRGLNQPLPQMAGEENTNSLYAEFVFMNQGQGHGSSPLRDMKEPTLSHSSMAPQNKSTNPCRKVNNESMRGNRSNRLSFEMEDPKSLYNEFMDMTIDPLYAEFLAMNNGQGPKRIPLEVKTGTTVSCQPMNKPNISEDKLSKSVAKSSDATFDHTNSGANGDATHGNNDAMPQLKDGSQNDDSPQRKKVTFKDTTFLPLKNDISQKTITLEVGASKAISARDSDDQAIKSKIFTETSNDDFDANTKSMINSDIVSDEASDESDTNTELTQTEAYLTDEDLSDSTLSSVNSAILDEDIPPIRQSAPRKNRAMNGNDLMASNKKQGLQFFKPLLRATPNISAKTFSQVHNDARTVRQGLHLDRAPLEVVLDKSGKNSFANGAMPMKSGQLSQKADLKPIADRSTNKINKDGNPGIHGRGLNQLLPQVTGEEDTQSTLRIESSSVKGHELMASNKKHFQDEAGLKPASSDILDNKNLNPSCHRENSTVPNTLSADTIIGRQIGKTYEEPIKTDTSISCQQQNKPNINEESTCIIKAVAKSSDATSENTDVMLQFDERNPPHTPKRKRVKFKDTAKWLLKHFAPKAIKVEALPAYHDFDDNTLSMINSSILDEDTPSIRQSVPKKNCSVNGNDLMASDKKRIQDEAGLKSASSDTLDNKGLNTNMPASHRENSNFTNALSTDAMIDRQLEISNEEPIEKDHMLNLSEYNISKLNAELSHATSDHTNNGATGDGPHRNNDAMPQLEESNQRNASQRKHVASEEIRKAIKSEVSTSKTVNERNSDAQTIQSKIFTVTPNEDSDANTVSMIKSDTVPDETKYKSNADHKLIQSEAVSMINSSILDEDTLSIVQSALRKTLFLNVYDLMASDKKRIQDEARLKSASSDTLDNKCLNTNMPAYHIENSNFPNTLSADAMIGRQLEIRNEESIEKDHMLNLSEYNISKLNAELSDATSDHTNNGATGDGPHRNNDAMPQLEERNQRNARQRKQVASEEIRKAIKSEVSTSKTVNARNSDAQAIQSKIFTVTPNEDPDANTVSMIKSDTVPDETKDKSNADHKLIQSEAVSMINSSILDEDTLSIVQSALRKTFFLNVYDLMASDEKHIQDEARLKSASSDILDNKGLNTNMPTSHRENSNFPNALSDDAMIGRQLEIKYGESIKKDTSVCCQPENKQNLSEDRISKSVAKLSDDTFDHTNNGATGDATHENNDAMPQLEERNQGNIRQRKKVTSEKIRKAIKSEVSTSKTVNARNSDAQAIQSKIFTVTPNEDPDANTVSIIKSDTVPYETKYKSNSDHKLIQSEAVSMINSSILDEDTPPIGHSALRKNCFLDVYDLMASDEKHTQDEARLKSASSDILDNKSLNTNMPASHRENNTFSNALSADAMIGRQLEIGNEEPIEKDNKLNLSEYSIAKLVAKLSDDTFDHSNNGATGDGPHRNNDAMPQLEERNQGNIRQRKKVTFKETGKAIKSEVSTRKPVSERNSDAQSTQSKIMTVTLNEDSDANTVSMIKSDTVPDETKDKKHANNKLIQCEAWPAYHNFEDNTLSMINSSILDEDTPSIGRSLQRKNCSVNGNDLMASDKKRIQDEAGLISASSHTLDNKGLNTNMPTSHRENSNFPNTLSADAMIGRQLEIRNEESIEKDNKLNLSEYSIAKLVAKLSDATSYHWNNGATLDNKGLNANMPASHRENSNFPNTLSADAMIDRQLEIGNEESIEKDNKLNLSEYSIAKLVAKLSDATSDHSNNGATLDNKGLNTNMPASHRENSNFPNALSADARIGRQLEISNEESIEKDNKLNLSEYSIAKLVAKLSDATSDHSNNGATLDNKGLNTNMPASHREKSNFPNALSADARIGRQLEISNEESIEKDNKLNLSEYSIAKLVAKLSDATSYHSNNGATGDGPHRNNDAMPQLEERNQGNIRQRKQVAFKETTLRPLKHNISRKAIKSEVSTRKPVSERNSDAQSTQSKIMTVTLNEDSDANTVSMIKSDTVPDETKDKKHTNNKLIQCEAWPAYHNFEDNTLSMINSSILDEDTPSVNSDIFDADTLSISSDMFDADTLSTSSDIIDADTMLTSSDIFDADTLSTNSDIFSNEAKLKRVASAKQILNKICAVKANHERFVEPNVTISKILKKVCPVMKYF